MTIAALVYGLCAATSLACALLLLRGFLQKRHRLLFWSGLCFLGFAVNNSLLLLDKIVFPSVDLSTWRLAPALIGIALLLYGLISTED